MKTLFELIILFFILFITISRNQYSYSSEYSHILIKFNIFMIILITQFIFNIIYDYYKYKKINPKNDLLDSINTGFAGIIGYSLYNDILLININFHHYLYTTMASPLKNSFIQTLITVFFIAFVKSIKYIYYGINLIAFKDIKKCNKNKENTIN